MVRTEWMTPPKITARESQMDIKQLQRGALLLPGPECLDIKHGLDTGIFTREESRILAVERDVDLVYQLRNTLERFKFNRMPAIHRHELTTLRVKDAFPGRSLDFAYLDLCGALSESLCRWLQRLPQVLHTGSFVALTLLRNYRREPFMPRLLSSSLFTGTSFRRDLIDECPGISHTSRTMLGCVLACLSPCRLRVHFFSQYSSTDGPGASQMLAVTLEVMDVNDITAVPPKIRQRLPGVLSA